MTGQNKEQIKAKILFETGWCGTLCLTPIGPNLYRVEETPIISGEVKYFDIIETKKQNDGTLLFKRVVEKSKFRAFGYLIALDVIRSKQFQMFWTKILQEGGYCETVFGGCVFIYLLPDSKIDPESEIKTIIDGLKAEG
jgi:hypothetical protein